jgi:hypothetical protein
MTASKLLAHLKSLSIFQIDELAAKRMEQRFVILLSAVMVITSILYHHEASFILKYTPIYPTTYPTSRSSISCMIAKSWTRICIKPGS